MNFLLSRRVSSQGAFNMAARRVACDQCRSVNANQEILSGHAVSVG
jgi:hypothetical protein